MVKVTKSDHSKSIEHALDMLIDCVIVIRMDSVIQIANQAAHTMFGYEQGSLAGKNVKELMPKSISDHHDELMLSHGSTIRKVGKNRQVLAKRFDGTLFPIEIAIAKHSIEDQPMFVGVIRDMSERFAAEAQSRERMHMLTMTEQMAGIGYWSVDLVANKISWSDQVYRIHGVDPRSHQPNFEDAINFYHPDDRELVNQHIETALANKTSFEFELRIINTRNEIRYVRSKGDVEVNSEGKPVALFGVLQDVTEYKAIQQELEDRNQALEQTTLHLRHQANTDNLTGLANRRAFFRQMKQFFTSMKRVDGGIGLLMIDIDLFKQVNDKHGHDIGDKVICRVAKVLKLYSREEDMVARLGGEEFAIVLPRSEPTHIAQVAERYRQSVQEQMGSELPNVTISIGTTYISADQLISSDTLPASERTELLLKQADLALYKAKDSGRNQVQYQALVLHE